MNTPFPLSTGVYSMHGRKYRKTSYQLKNLASANRNCQQIEQFYDTPDVYDDEPSVGCFAPPGFLKETIAKNTKETSPKELDNKAETTEDACIQIIDGKKWKALVSVPSCFIGKLIGTNRRALNALEHDTQCRVKTPRRDQSAQCEISSIVSLECVQRCLDRIEIFINDARKSARVTHFVAFPSNQKEVKENFNVFKQLVMDGNEVDKSCKNALLFTKPSRLHLTLAVTTLVDETDLQKTMNAFNTLEHEIREMLGHRPFIVNIQGIDMMNDDPSLVSVIYAKVSGDRVQEIANHVKRRLTDLEISSSGKREDLEDVKLHMTLMNARYLNLDKSAIRKEGMHFDARSILNDLKDFHFGDVQLTEICLCPLSSNSTTAEEKFYDKLAIINLT